MMLAVVISLLAAVPERERAVTASLISEVDSIQPARPFWLGVRLQMAPGWHTYWKNSGDSGLPTRVTWNLPAGFSAGSLHWPYPERLASGPLMDFGYQDDVVLLAEITPGPAIEAGQAALAVQVKWLECREKCLPGSADLSITLPVKAAPPLTAASSAAIFRKTRRRLPKESAGWSFASHEARPHSVILRPPQGIGQAHEAYFFPDQPATLEHAAPQRLERRGTRWWLELVRDANAKSLETLRGVVAVKPRQGAQTRALAVEARARKEESE